MARNETIIQRDWLAKSLAGVGLGLVFALGASAVFARTATTIPGSLRTQLVMWMVPPIWFTIASSVYFFTTGRRAWLWLGSASGLVWGLALLLKRFG